MTTTSEGAVSWGAVIAGAVGAAALSLVLFLLGTGLGLAAVSPWSREGISGTTAGVSTIIWITVVQLLASALGGYLAGRLRTRWVTVHTNEVFFRDTAHGFLAWAVATLLMATLLSSAIGTANLIRYQGGRGGRQNRRDDGSCRRGVRRLQRLRGLLRGFAVSRRPQQGRSR
jgi:MFS family permease